jgi:hypothetical protein
MKNGIQAVIGILVVWGITISASDASLINGLAGYWSLNGTLADGSSTEADGVFYDAWHNQTQTAGTPVYVAAPVGQGLNLTAYRDGNGDAVGQIVRMGEHAEHDFGASTDFSLAGWFRWDNTDDEMVYSALAGKKQTRGSNRAGYLVSVDRINAASANLRFRMTDAVNDVSITAPLVLSTNVWYHFAVTIDRDSTAQIYINGQTNGAPVSVSAIGDINAPAGTEFAIGSTHWMNQQSFFDGTISEVGLWNRQLTGTEIEYLAASNAIPEPSAALLLILAFGVLGARHLRGRHHI